MAFFSKFNAVLMLSQLLLQGCFMKYETPLLSIQIMHPHDGRLKVSLPI